VTSATKTIVDYDKPVRIADGVYWVGTYDSKSGWLSSPYLVVDENGEAVLIDGGSRSDFASVVMKIMQAEVIPSSILALIYQNYNPRLWGSLQHLEVIINRQDLSIVSDVANLMFIQHHSESVSLVSLEDLNYEFRFSSGRCLKFVKTPFAHSAGSFVTFDEKTRVLFSGDLFSSYLKQWDFNLNLKLNCKTCPGHDICPEDGAACPLKDILDFHVDIMSSERALKFALEKIAEIPFKIIAPQHGSIISKSDDIVALSERLSSLQGVGIDGIIGGRSFLDLGNTQPIRERLLGKNTPHGLG
jgi:flavorubredoxin